MCFRTNFIKGFMQMRILSPIEIDITQSTCIRQLSILMRTIFPSTNLEPHANKNHVGCNSYVCLIFETFIIRK